jgi:hypothetical protein
MGGRGAGWRRRPWGRSSVRLGFRAAVGLRLLASFGCRLAPRVARFRGRPAKNRAVKGGRVSAARIRQPQRRKHPSAPGLFDVRVVVSTRTSKSEEPPRALRRCGCSGAPEQPIPLFTDERTDSGDAYVPASSRGVGLRDLRTPRSTRHPHVPPCTEIHAADIPVGTEAAAAATRRSSAIGRAPRRTELWTFRRTPCYEMSPVRAATVRDGPRPCPWGVRLPGVANQPATGPTSSKGNPAHRLGVPVAAGPDSPRTPGEARPATPSLLAQGGPSLLRRRPSVPRHAASRPRAGGAGRPGARRARRGGCMGTGSPARRAGR